MNGGIYIFRNPYGWWFEDEEDESVHGPFESLDDCLSAIDWYLTTRIRCATS